MASDLSGRIQQLLDERARHAEALVRIEDTLSSIDALLGTSLTGMETRRGRPRKLNAPQPTTSRSRRRRGRGSYETTADEFVLGFVRGKRNPTTREINAHWKSGGRGHTADNTLVKLVKAGQLRRIPLEVGRGSRYMAV